MLTTRLATAAVAIPLLAAVIWVGDALLAAVVAVAAAVATLEIVAARGRQVAGADGGTLDRLRPSYLLAAVLAGLLPAAALAGEDELLGAVALAVLLPAAALAFTREPADGAQTWLWTAAPALYFGYLAAHFVLLRELPDGREWLFLAVLSVWVADTGAYFLGRAVGRHRLAAAVSPGKTWEGAFGQLVTGFAAVAALNAALGLDRGVEHVVALGVIVPVAALLGDLAESALKRALAVKDASGLVPGHGGIADRLDSLLFAAPVVYWYARWVVL